MNTLKETIAEIEQEMELARMMVADIDRVFKKYAKAAVEAEKQRIERIKTEKYMDCDTELELQNLYGYASITEAEYYAGLEFLKTREQRLAQLSIIEKHRQNVKEIRDRWKGTINELQEELDELNGVTKDTRNAFEKLADEERAERMSYMRASDF